MWGYFIVVYMGKFIFLSSDFYNDYPATEYPEIEQKALRPYIQLLTLIDGIQYAIPLRSHITHPHVFWTDKQNQCGLDFSKAVVISKQNYIDNTKVPHIRQNEFDALRGKDYRIQQKMAKYIADYKKAKTKDDEISQELCRNSTLQYFEEYIKGESE